MLQPCREVEEQRIRRRGLRLHKVDPHAKTPARIAPPRAFRFCSPLCDSHGLTVLLTPLRGRSEMRLLPETIRQLGRSACVCLCPRRSPNCNTRAHGKKIRTRCVISNGRSTCLSNEITALRFSRVSTCRLVLFNLDEFLYIASAPWRTSKP